MLTGARHIETWVDFHDAPRLRKSKINHVEQEKREALGRLKGVQNQKAVIEKNIRALETKKAKLQKKRTVISFTEKARMRLPPQRYVEPCNPKSTR